MIRKRPNSTGKYWGPVFLLIFLGATAALASPPPKSIAGAWEFVFDTEGGERRAPVVLRLEGETVTGTFGSPDTKITGTFAKGVLKISFPFYSDEAQLHADLTITGKLVEDKLSGDWDFGDHGGTFEAARPPESPDEPPAEQKAE